MAISNYPQELVALVEEYLTDGVITDRERRVLLKKAESMGVDTEEFDLYIDAQQQKIHLQIDATARMRKGKTCPFCGNPIPQLADKCPHCDNLVTAEADEKLLKIVSKLEGALVDFKSGSDSERSRAYVERYLREAKVYYGNNPTVKLLIADVEAEMKAAKSIRGMIKRHKNVFYMICLFAFLLLLIILIKILGY